MKRTILFYHTATGKCPVEDFLDSLPAKAVQKITWVLRLLEELDFIPSQYFKKLKVIKYGDAGSHLALILTGFFVSSQRNPLSY